MNMNYYTFWLLFIFLIIHTEAEKSAGKEPPDICQA